MDECRKRQVERKGDEVKYRCMHRQAGTRGQHVDASICGACPMRVYIEQAKPKKTPNGTIALPVVDTSGYPSCEFRFAMSGKATCGVTGLPVSQEVCNRCAKDSKMDTPTLKDKVISYSKALRKWYAAGRPERSDERVQEIFDKYCSGCSMYDKEKGICNSCGCPSNTNQPAIRNKLKMATEKCPLGQWE